MTVSQLLGRAWPATITAKSGQDTVTLVCLEGASFPNWSVTDSGDPATDVLDDSDCYDTYGYWTVVRWTRF